MEHTNQDAWVAAMRHSIQQRTRAQRVHRGISPTSDAEVDLD